MTAVAALSERATIRRADLFDLPAIKRLGRDFFEAAQWSDIADWDEASAERTALSLIGGVVPGGLLIAETADETVGMAGYVLFPFSFNHALLIAQEMFWYVDPKHRFGAGRDLMDALEESARAQGATVLIMASIAGLRDAAVARLYARRGYRPAENTFVKRL